jgi:hypothetical protein
VIVTHNSRAVGGRQMRRAGLVKRQPHYGKVNAS